MLDRLLLVACVLIVAALILYFFFWNRFIAFVLVQVIRFWYWDQEASSVWIEIGSIHFSLLAGRILVRGIRYHSSNQTIKIVKGQIQWRYWLRRPITEDDIGLHRGDDESQTSRPDPCRIHISLHGFEWFLCNRTAAFESIVAQMDGLSRTASRASAPQRSTHRTTTRDSGSPFYPSSRFKRATAIPATIQNAMAWLKMQMPNLDPKELLPLGLEVIKGAIVCGNSSTSNLLVAEFQVAEGTFGVTPSKSKYDLYKQLLSLVFKNASIRYAHNDDYVDSMTTIGNLVHNRIAQHPMFGRVTSYLSFKGFVRIWRQVGMYMLATKYSETRRAQRSAQQAIATSTRMPKKTKKVIEEETPVGIDFSGYEYAIERQILEAPDLKLSYYVDVVGDVPDTQESSLLESVDIGNGDTSPEWGFDIIIHGGVIRYGPWADRARAEIQRIFFPPTYQNMTVTPRLCPGEKRTWTSLQVFIELRDETTLHIPFREASKDWQWDGLSDVPGRPKKREAAAFNVTVGDRSSVNYFMPLVATSNGYDAVLEVHLDTVLATSTLNDIRIVNAESCRIRGELPTPLIWNDARTWLFTVSLRQPILYLLRDHINMFTDLGRDWASGPPTDWQKFVPTLYDVDLAFHHYELNLYANDQNIIDKPLIPEENALVILHGTYMKGNVKIPLNKFRPESTIIKFKVEAPDISVDFSLPRWSTHALHAPKFGHKLMHAKVFEINGSYLYFAEVRDEFIEQLKLTFELREVAFRALGWSIRYFMVLRDNYFGSFTHFSTLLEYLSKRERGIEVGDPLSQKYREGKSNMMQVEMSLILNQVAVLLQAGLLGYEIPSSNSNSNSMNPSNGGQCIVMHVPESQLHFRLHDYYMEMSLNVGMVRGYIEAKYPDRVAYSKPMNLKTSREIFIIEGIDIVANRLFGPQPKTSTYFCVWEIRLGHLKSSLCVGDDELIMATANSFRLNFADEANAPADEYLPITDPDVTFLKVTFTSIEITWRAGCAALNIAFPQGIKFNTNDLGTLRYKKVTALVVPVVQCRVLLTAQSQRNNRWLEAADFVIDAYIDIYDAPSDFLHGVKKQQSFVYVQDKITRRAQRLLEQLQSGRTVNTAKSDHLHNVYLPQIKIPSTYASTVAVHDTSIYIENHSRKPPSWSMSAQGDAEESDAEEAVSEVDRDARLAKSRSLTPIPVFKHDAEDALTSGEESDNADLTGDESSDSDWMEVYEPEGDDSDILSMGFYARLTRHFVTNKLGMPGLWEGPSFLMTKERPILYKAEDVKIAELPAFPLSTPADQVTATANRKTICLRFRRRLEMRITPLVVKALEYIEEDLRRLNISPELHIDSLVAKHLSRFSLQNESISRFVLDVIVPSVNIQVLQHVPMEDGFPVSKPKSSHLYTASNLDKPAVVEVLMQGMHIMCSTGAGADMLKAFAQKLQVKLQLPTGRRSIPTGNNITVFELTFNDSTAELANTRAQICTEICTKMGHHGPEFLASVANLIVGSIEDIVSLSQIMMRRSNSRTRNIISYIIQASHDKSILDPLSTIQPSYLVQTGIPHQLRTDITFKFLFHLRNSLWILDKEERMRFSSVLNGDAPVSTDEYGELLESRLSALDQDGYNVRHLTFLERTFATEGTYPKDHSNIAVSFDFIALEVKSIYIAVIDRIGTPSANLSLQSIRMVGELRDLEVVQLPSYTPSSISQASLRSKGTRVLRKWALHISIATLTSAMQPQLIDFAQRILLIRQHSKKRSPVVPGSSLETSSLILLQLRKIDFVLSIERLHIQAAAAKLTVEFGLLGVQVAVDAITRKGQTSHSTNTCVIFEQSYLRARSPETVKSSNLQDVLAAFTIRGGKLNVLGKQEYPSRPQLKVIFSLDSFLLSVPRSALHLYRFVEEWRADFLTGIEATVKTLVSNTHTDKMSDPKAPSTTPIIHMHGQIVHFEISLQIMHGTWLTWEIHRTIGHVQSSHIGSHIHAFGLQLSSMNLNVSSTKMASDMPSDSRVKLSFPSLSLAGDFDDTHAHALLLVDFVELKLKPSHWDTLLAVQQKFGQDFNDLVSLMQKSQSSRSCAPVPDKSSGKPMRYSGFLKMRGFRVGLESRTSTVFLECSDVGGGMKNATGWAWDIALSGLTLSLSRRSAEQIYNMSQASHRSAFVTIDFKISAEEPVGEKDGDNIIQLFISRIHAVMQPSSIGEVGDFIDHLQAEVLERKEQRALELANFKEKARRILKTFDVNIGETQPDETPLLSNYVVKVAIHSIGVAFPLTTDEKLEPLRTTHSNHPVRAFLFSIKSIEFTTYRGETGQAAMKNFSFAFISKFSQSVASHFSGDMHNTCNRLVYPEMKAQLRTSRSANSREIWIGANVSGFILDLDSSIPDYIFSLVDVYRQGKDRMERLSVQLPRTPSSATPTLETGKKSLERHYSAIPTSNVFCSLTFLSGKVRVYSNSAMTSILSRFSSGAYQELTDDQLLELGSEVFKLPILTVWSEYRATPASQKLNSDQYQEPSVLMFKATVHSSNNTLRPKLLPFVTELVDLVETRLRKVGSQTTRSTSSAMSQTSNAAQRSSSENTPPVSSMRITFNLRIDRSKLELTCQPDVNVVAGLHWDSGGFIVTISPGAQKVTFIGSVSGLKVGLKHGFLSEDCLNLDARNLAFSVTFAKVASSLGSSLGFISVVLDTQFHGGVRFSRLQDILCFKAVWLDRIPVFNSQVPAGNAGDMKSFDTPSDSSIPKDGLSTVILLRIRQIKLDVDLGQSISALSLDLKPAILQTKLTDLANEVSIFVGEVVLSATGNLSGHAYVPKCVFQTIRRSETAVVNSHGHGRMLELRMTSGTLIASLESDSMKLLHYRAEPLEVEIHDDWSKTSHILVNDERPLQLSFTVASTEIVAIVMVGTIPKLLSYVNKFKANLHVQRLGASRESALFRATRSPKPDNPLSAVAEAMLLSARTRFKEAGVDLAYAIKQHMSLRVDFLRLVVFPRTMEDSEIAHFIGKEVRARLDRFMATEAKPAIRDLHLSFSSMTISKYTQFGHPALGLPHSWDELDKTDWIDNFLKYASEATIVGLPSMKMHMVSEEIVEEFTTTLLYDFYSEFVRREGMKAMEDIFITLNVSLYSWLTVLRKNLTREMDQVQAAEEWRSSLASDIASSVGAMQRKKSPSEPLSPSASSDTQKSFTLPVQPYPSPIFSDPTKFSAERSITSPVPIGTPVQSPTLHSSPPVTSPIPSIVVQDTSGESTSVQLKRARGATTLKYQPRNRHIERLTMRQLGEATPDVMHPFFMKKSGFNLEDSLPQYVNEYATVPLEEIMDLLLKLYSRQLSKKHGDLHLEFHN